MSTGRPAGREEERLHGLRGFRGLLRAPQFRRLLVAQAIAGLGNWVATLAFIAAAFALTGSQAAVGAVLVLRLLPPMLAAPVGGIVADRFDRRTIMVTCDLIRAGLIALVPFVGIALLLVIAFVHELISLFFLPARDASVPRLVPRGELPAANGLVLATSYGSLPFAAGVFSGLRMGAENLPEVVPFAEFFHGRPTSLAFFFNAATFLLSASLISRIRIPQERRRTALTLSQGALEALRYVTQRPALRSLAYGVFVAMFGGGVLFAVGIAYVHRTLGASDTEFGWLASLWGVGMGLGLLLSRLPLGERKAWLFLGGVVACGGVLVAMGLVPYLPLAMGIAVVFGAAFSVAIILAISVTQQSVEDEIRGRIMGGVQMLFRVGLGAGAIAMGGMANAIAELDLWVVTLDGNQVGMVAGGVLILLGAAAATGAVRAEAWAEV